MALVILVAAFVAELLWIWFEDLDR